MGDTIFVGIAGGTGSGKTTVAYKIFNAFQGAEVALIEQDSYYKDLPELTYDERSKINFDHPDSLDFDLLISHLRELRAGRNICKPVYDFTVHQRSPEVDKINPARIVVVEGILIFAIPELREMFDVKVFVDTDADERLLRRIERDIKERGRTFESVKEQYLKTVKPMYLEFAEPSKRYANVIIPRGGMNKVATNMIIAKLRSLLG